MHRYSARGVHAQPSGSRGRPSRPRNYDARQARSIPPALGVEITKRSLEGVNVSAESGETEISNCRFVASYNLLEGLQKTIFVPGRPPLWTPLPESVVLSPDSGDYYRDENAARFPDYPMEPAVMSIFQMNPSFDSSRIDVFGCGSTLGDILRFCIGTPQPFSFIVHMIGNTAFFLRRNHSPTELIENVQGYGHAFPEAYTTWSQDVKGSASHQRIIRYSFGGLRFLVRFEADGYTPDQAHDSEDDEYAYQSGMIKAGASSDTSSGAPIEKLLENVLRPNPPDVDRANTSLLVRVQGRRTSQSSVFDLKTRSSRKERDKIMAEQIPRLWVRQIHRFVLAFHTNGRFDPPDLRDITSEIRDWEQDSKIALGRMATLVREIRETAMATSGGKLEVRGAESSTLQLHKLSGANIDQWNALPHGLQKRWA